MIQVNVRWLDGYYESFDCEEVRFGCDLLWIKLPKIQNRHIPLRNVRWFSVNPESHENIDGFKIVRERQERHYEN